MRRIVTGLIGLLLLSQVGTGRPRKDVAHGSGNDELTFELVSGYLVIVDGSIGPLQGLRFVLDTGATHTAVSNKIADQLELQCVTGNVFNFDKVVNTDWAVIPAVQVGPIRASQVPAMITNLDYFKSLGTHVDAVLGLDLLRQKNFSIDFAEKKVRFGQMEVGKHSTRLLADDMALHVEAEANGRLIQLIVDTGAPGPMMYEERLKNRAVAYSAEEENYAYRLDGVLRLTRGRVRSLTLGGRDIESRVFLTHSPAKGTLDGVDGFLGLTALKARQINFDFGTNTLSWSN
jgi:predicted aspartyl protease